MVTCCNPLPRTINQAELSAWLQGMDIIMIIIIMVIIITIIIIIIIMII